MRNRAVTLSWHNAVPLAAIALLVACGEPTTTPEPKTLPTKPLASATEPFNDEGVCLAQDAFLAGVTSGVNDADDLADPKQHCTSNDISIATVDVIEYSLDGTTFIPFTGQAVTCNENDPIFVRLNAHLSETATSERTDIGIWIGLNGSNARTGTCNHYNLVAPALGQTVDGVSNFDSDACGDMDEGAESEVELGVISALCQTAPGSNNLLHIGSCLAWTQPGTGGDDRTCPRPGTPGPNGFRFGTVPGTTSKCNCDGFDVPIIVAKTAKLEIRKACTPANDNGTFDLLIDGSNQFADNVTCGGTTGSQEVSAGTTASPGAVHTFGEGDFTTANYTSSFECVNRAGGSHAPASGSSLGPVNITLLPDEDVICTYTNVRKAGITIIKDAVPNGPTDFGFTTTGGLAPSTFILDDDGDPTRTTTQSYTNITPGQYTVTEDVVAGFDLTNLVCDDANSVEDIANRKATINLEAGETVTCTFTNTQRGQINIVKQTDPDGVAGNFSFSHNVGTNSDPQVTTPFLLSDGQTQQILLVKNGTYSVTEAALAGFDLVASGAGFTTGCTDPTTNSSINTTTRVATINLAPGETVTCTFVNRQRATLTLAKSENGGLPLSRPWSFELRTGTSETQAGALVATASANVNTGVVSFPGTFAPGAYQLCETGMPVNWTNNFDGFTPLGATPEGGDNSTECINITLVSGTNGPGGILGVPNPIDNELPPPPGGDARTIGYWKNWSSCTGGNQYAKALERGEWNKTLDGNLPQTVGDLVLDGALAPNQPAVDCVQAVRILNKSAINTGKKMASDPAYNLAAQFLAALLNYEAGATQCQAATDAINAAQTLLDAINFNGTGTYRNTMTPSQITQANTLAGTLDDYNNNDLCPVIP